VRHVNTKQESAGYAAVGGVGPTVEVKRDYDLTLPSFNLAADVTDTFVARFSAAKTIARPGIGSLSPGGDVAVQGANRSFSSGNPYLNPTQSKNLDLSLEWYPSSGTMFAAGFFYKKIDTFVATQSEQRVYNTLGLPDSLIAGTTATPDMLFQVSKPINTKGGDLKGFELNVQQPFTFLPGWLEPLRRDRQLHLRRLQDRVSDLVDGGRAGRDQRPDRPVEERRQRDALLRDRQVERPGLAGLSRRLPDPGPGSDGNTVQGTNETLNVDMQASWNIRENLKLSLEGVNLTDEFNDQYVGDSNRLNVYTHSGRQFIVGLRYNF
jgi:iron complex outermembrane receptor protein